MLQLLRSLFGNAFTVNYVNFKLVLFGFQNLSCFLRPVLVLV